MKKKLFFLLSSYTLFFSTGCWNDPCPYTELTYEVSEKLKNSKIVIEKTGHVAKGAIPEYKCLPVLGSVTNELVDPEWIEINGKESREKKGQKFSLLTAKSKEFRIIGKVSVRKHGILNTIDSGPGPTHFLILQDQVGEKYQIFYSNLDEFSKNYFLKIVASGAEQK